MSDRTFKVQAPHMAGSDVHDWQSWLRDQFRAWNIAYPLAVDGDYGVATRAATASMCEAMGLAAPYGMEDGVTPALRIKLRNRDLTAAERARFVARVGYRRKLRLRFEHGGSVHTPVSRIITDSWGYHPGVHDGIDLICPPDATLYAICTGRVLRADPSGWWGLGAPSDPALKAKGDGIIVVRCQVSAGPFRPGLNFGYGHAEHAVVSAGDTVKAGDLIGKAGFANAWHVHLVVNGRSDAKGVGDRDPRPFTDYARSHT